MSHTAVYVARNNFKQPWQEEEANSHLAPRVGCLCPSLMRALYRARALRSELVTQPYDKKTPSEVPDCPAWWCLVWPGGKP